ncbi:carboxysome shell protein CsoS2 [Prochlorococcus marinus str. MIT 9302]|uniref:Carboxysome shell protein CsoS2 n=1 Tax=Prochlorococcus marinus str. MIT 9302 TaxID=74545 RepID=A0A0A2A9I8_PROMR|nr:CsoS2 family carboxysome shell protein [Prochlorococcus marinus]KGF97496.1 carboxysome shell protein CsoS2 [Prochlorococcus marinus str. MIT 9302]
MSKKTSREIALERRKAMSDSGKKAAAYSSTTQDRVRSSQDIQISGTQSSSNNQNIIKPATKHIPKTKVNRKSSSTTLSAKELVIERRKAMSTHGKSAIASSDRTRTDFKKEISVNEVKPTVVENQEMKNSNNTETKTLKPNVKRRINQKRKPIANTSRDIVLARREAQSKHGKSASKQNTSAASLARRGDPDLSSREISQRVRELRSKTGATGSNKGNGKCRPCGPNKNGAKQNIADASWKVGKSETDSGQIVTGTQANRSIKTTGNEASTCRTVTGTQYMGADVIDQFCQDRPSYKQPLRSTVTSTTSGNKVTGNEVGRSERVTGDEPGTCKNLTGTEYVSANQSQKYCGEVPKNPSKVKHSTTTDGLKVSGSLPGRSTLVTGDESGSGHQLTGDQYLGSEPNPKGKAFEKVGIYNTLNGNNVTGTGVGRSDLMTGNEHGSCKNVTGDEYIGSQQYEKFCGSKPKPEARKVGLSLSSKSNLISGTMTGRSKTVTGDEPGSCKVLTGTPYAGLDQINENCSTETSEDVKSRATVNSGNNSNARLTGQQPGIGGVMTGAKKGACKNLTGTPYIGGDQFSKTCDNPPDDNEYANPEKSAGNSWNEFSVKSPSREKYSEKNTQGVTGNEYENGSKITGPFDMAVDKVTGTEKFRFEPNKNITYKQKMQIEEADRAAKTPEKRVASRITGEGQSVGNVTGDDWDRGDKVTGTEGASSRKRNPSRAGNMSAMPPLEVKRNEETEKPDFLITGSSGNTRDGQLVTFSGGARG